MFCPRRFAGGEGNGDSRWTRSTSSKGRSGVSNIFKLPQDFLPFHGCRREDVRCQATSHVTTLRPQTVFIASTTRPLDKRIMITPLFSVSQTEKDLHLRIRAPHSRPREIQISADDHDFHFYTSPYLLHLSFEHGVFLSEQTSSLSYDLETGVATVTLQKLDPYPHFTKLDMLSTLLVTRPSTREPPSIEVLKTTTLSADADESAVQMLQTTTDSGLELPLRELSLGRPTYGFGGRYEAVFATRAEDITQVVELPYPDSTPVWRRASLRKAAEDAKFNRKIDRDHFMADFLLVDEYRHVMEYVPTLPDVAQRLPDHFVDVLLKLPKREYLQEVDVRAAADLAGILFASAYDMRSTLGERNVESAWTVSRLCATMSFLEGFRKVRDAVLAAYRRSLAYPLYRNFVLADRVLADLKMVVDVADVDVLRARLLRILLGLRETFEDDKLLRLHNDILLTDYCIWIQKVDDDILARMRNDILEVVIERHELEWDISGLETRARRLADGEIDGEDNENPKVQNQGDAPPVEPAFLRESDKKKKVDTEITISALSSFPMAGLKMDPVTSRKLQVSVSDSSSYEYVSSSDESS